MHAELTVNRGIGHSGRPRRYGSIENDIYLTSMHRMHRIPPVFDFEPVSSHQAQGIVSGATTRVACGG